MLFIYNIYINKSKKKFWVAGFKLSQLSQLSQTRIEWKDNVKKTCQNLTLQK